MLNLQRILKLTGFVSLFLLVSCNNMQNVEQHSAESSEVVRKSMAGLKNATPITQLNIIQQFANNTSVFPVFLLETQQKNEQIEWAGASKIVKPVTDASFMDKMIRIHATNLNETGHIGKKNLAGRLNSTVDTWYQVGELHFIANDYDLKIASSQGQNINLDEYQDFISSNRTTKINDFFLNSTGFGSEVNRVFLTKLLTDRDDRKYAYQFQF
ncbi:hypothetical protein [Aliikangiella coralliicola]|uniref:Uncharacterized protein n=1 Tax=Aliikangiella coralliicola TaxID=2592383 RepID=A0A545UH60_9GAMM|nr:hypothetical protein [Aliikangiella coralliicola]TQV88798.1 hypothetical protein FLL46_04500 [Aliikangiella coralliicola]